MFSLFSKNISRDSYVQRLGPEQAHWKVLEDIFKHDIVDERVQPQSEASEEGLRFTVREGGRERRKEGGGRGGERRSLFGLLSRDSRSPDRDVSELRNMSLAEVEQHLLG